MSCNLLELSRWLHFLIWKSRLYLAFC